MEDKQQLIAKISWVFVTKYEIWEKPINESLEHIIVGNRNVFLLYVVTGSGFPLFPGIASIQDLWEGFQTSKHQFLEFKSKS